MIVVATSSDLLNPFAPPGGRVERVREILRLVYDLSIAEFHDAHCECRAPLVVDCVFSDPQITHSENSLYAEAGRLAWVMTSQGLQIASPENALA